MALTSRYKIYSLKIINAFCVELACKSDVSVSEISKLRLLESCCLPILTYAVEGLPLKKKQIDNLNTCWNNAYRKIFRMKKCESVRELISLCGRL